MSKKSPNTDFDTFFDSFSGLLGLFRHFFDTPGGEAWEDRFETFLGFRVETPVKGGSHRISKALCGALSGPGPTSPPVNGGRDRSSNCSGTFGISRPYRCSRHDYRFNSF